MRRFTTLLVAVTLGLTACTSSSGEAVLSVEATSLVDAPVAGVADAAVAWAGTEYVVVGGVAGSEKFGADGEPETADDGPLGGAAALAHAFDPAAGTWRQLAPPPLAPRSRALAVWTGTEVLVWGGTPRRNGIGGLLDGALYDPATDSWRTIPEAPAGADRSFAQAVVVGDKVVIGAGSGPSSDDDRDLYVYDLGSESWSMLASGDGPVLQLLAQDDDSVVVLSALAANAREGHRVRTLTLDGEQVGPDVVITEPAEGEEFPLTAGLVAGADQLWLLLQPANGDTRVYDLTSEDPVDPVARHPELAAAVDVFGLGTHVPTAVVDGLAVSWPRGLTDDGLGLRLADGTAARVQGTGISEGRDCVNGGAWATDGDGGLLLVGGECDPQLVVVGAPTVEG